MHFLKTNMGRKKC